MAWFMFRNIFYLVLELIKNQVTPVFVAHDIAESADQPCLPQQIYKQHLLDEVHWSEAVNAVTICWCTFEGPAAYELW